MNARQKVLLVGPDQEENLSLRYLASSLMAAGHDVVIAPFDTGQDRASVVEAARSTTLVGLSLCFQVRTPQFLALARALKAQDPERLVIAGGHYASCAADELLAHHPEIDMVVLHEGERTLVDLADALGAQPASLARIQGLAYRAGERIARTEPRSALADLDALPPPLRTGPARLHAGVPTAYILGSRGCVSHCRYCCISTLHRMARGKRLRQRDPRRVADEMAHLYHHRGVRQFVFHDDNFLVPAVERNHRRLDALAAALNERGVAEIAFTIKCRPQDADPEIFARLRAMGLIRVFLGIESGSAAGLSCLGRTHTPEQARAALALCRDLGISAQYTMMIFHPAATLKSCRADLSFMRQNLDHPLNFCRTEIYAGTPLEQQMIAAGRARGNYLGRCYTIDDPRVQWVSDVSSRLFFERCWEGGGVMERAIGLDHLTAVMRHFYDDPRVLELAPRVLDWRAEVNRDTVALLEELFQIAERGAPWQSALVGLQRREQASRRALYHQGLALFDELNELTLSLVGLERQERGVARSRRPLASRLARHAAAAVLAIGVASWAGCDDETTTKTDIGVSEYAPPPVDGGPGDARLEIGMSEYAPPPADGGPVKLEGGMSEFAAPPVDGGQDDEGR